MLRYVVSEYQAMDVMLWTCSNSLFEKLSQHSWYYHLGVNRKLKNENIVLVRDISGCFIYDGRHEATFTVSACVFLTQIFQF